MGMITSLLKRIYPYKDPRRLKDMELTVIGTNRSTPKEPPSSNELDLFFETARPQLYTTPTQKTTMFLPKITPPSPSAFTIPIPVIPDYRVPEKPYSMKSIGQTTLPSSPTLQTKYALPPNVTSITKPLTIKLPQPLSYRISAPESGSVTRPLYIPDEIVKRYAEYLKPKNLSPILPLPYSQLTEFSSEQRESVPYQKITAIDRLNDLRARYPAIKERATNIGRNISAKVLSAYRKGKEFLENQKPSQGTLAKMIPLALTVGAIAYGRKNPYASKAVLEGLGEYYQSQAKQETAQANAIWEKYQLGEPLSQGESNILKKKYNLDIPAGERLQTAEEKYFIALRKLREKEENEDWSRRIAQANAIWRKYQSGEPLSQDESNILKKEYNLNIPAGRQPLTITKKQEMEQRRVATGEQQARVARERLRETIEENKRRAEREKAKKKPIVFKVPPNNKKLIPKKLIPETLSKHGGLH